MEKVVLAGDLGGTNLRVAAVQADGSIVYRAERPTPYNGSPDDIVDAVVSVAEECWAKIDGNSEIIAFGLAVAALVNSNEGKIHSSPNLPQLNGVELAALVSSRLELPVLLENDATAAAIGEHWLGASHEAENSICITLGTGVGGGLILNGEVYRGIDGTAGEIGHIIVEPEGEPCGCGSHGCLEQYASATAAVRIAGELSAAYPDSSLQSLENLTALDIYNAGLAGDKLSLEVFRRIGRYLGIALAGLVNVLNPDVIVLGGGAAAGWDLFIDYTRDELRKRAFRRPAERVEIRRAALGDDAGILGAARPTLESVITRG